MKSTFFKIQIIIILLAFGFSAGDIAHAESDTFTQSGTFSAHTPPGTPVHWEIPDFIQFPQEFGDSDTPKVVVSFSRFPFSGLSYLNVEASNITSKGFKPEISSGPVIKLFPLVIMNYVAVGPRPTPPVVSTPTSPANITLTVIAKYSDGTPVNSFQVCVGNYTSWVTSKNGIATISMPPFDTNHSIQVANLESTTTGAFCATTPVKSMVMNTEYDLTLNKASQTNTPPFPNQAPAIIRKTLKFITLTVKAKDGKGNAVTNFEAGLSPDQTAWYPTTNGVVTIPMNQFENTVSVVGVGLSGSTDSYSGGQVVPFLLHNQSFSLVLTGS